MTHSCFSTTEEYVWQVGKISLIKVITKELLEESLKSLFKIFLFPGPEGIRKPSTSPGSLCKVFSDRNLNDHKIRKNYCFSPCSLKKRACICVTQRWKGKSCFEPLSASTVSSPSLNIYYCFHWDLRKMPCFRTWINIKSKISETFEKAIHLKCRLYRAVVCNIV